MAARVPLTVQKRDRQAEKSKKLLKKSIVPGVVYGHGLDSQAVQVDYQTFRKAFEKATFSTILDLDIDGKTYPVLIQHVTYDPIFDTYTHIDFHAIRMDKKVTTTIPFDFTGESQAVREGNMLVTHKHDLHITCLPTDLIHSIEVDLTPLDEIGKSIHVSDLTIPSTIEVLDELSSSVVSVVEPRVIEEEIIEEEVEGEEGAEDEEGGEGEGEGEGGKESATDKEEGSEKKKEE